MSRKPKLLLVDDHHLVLEGLRLELQDEFEVAGMLASGALVAEHCLRLKPDLIVLDLSLPDRSGLEVIGDVLGVAPDTRILVVTMHADPVLADAGAAGGSGRFHIPKDAEVEVSSGPRSAKSWRESRMSPLLGKHAPSYSWVGLELWPGGCSRQDNRRSSACWGTEEHGAHCGGAAFESQHRDVSSSQDPQGARHPVGVGSIAVRARGAAERGEERIAQPT
jgi:CheY-like chemotaxis protein